MAYAAVISLKQTINALLNSSCVSTNREILEFAYSEAISLQRVLERLNDSSRGNSERVSDLEGQVRDCANQLEDVFELHESNDEAELRQEVTSFTEQVKRLEVEFAQELSKQDDDNKDDDDATDHQYFSSNNNIDSSVELLGYSSKLFITIQEDWMFDCIAWVKVGAECELKKVMIRILAQVDNLAAGEYEWLNDEKLVCKQLNKVLKHRRYMIVLDDVHDVQLIKHLKSSCPNQSNGSLVLFTTRSEEISQLADIPITFKRPRRFFEENMWFVLRGVCFHNESISAELEEAGIKIVQNCQSLSISLAKAFLFLLTAEKTVEPWSKLADSACRY